MKNNNHGHSTPRIGQYVTDVRRGSFLGVLSNILVHNGERWGIVKVKGREKPSRIRLSNLRRRFGVDQSENSRRERDRKRKYRLNILKSATAAVDPNIVRLAKMNGLSVKEVLRIRSS